MAKSEFKQMVDEISNKTIEFFKEHGDNHAGVGWFKPNGYNERYAAHCAVIDQPGRVLDFGCGLAGLYDWMQNHKYGACQYVGLDNSPEYLEACKKKYPHLEFLNGDILSDENAFGQFDYIIMCGIFTMKLGYSKEMMWDYTKKMLKAVWEKANNGISFNCTSPFVDWEREDLFHLPFDQILKFVNDELSRDFEVKAHYGGTYEYTIIVRKERQKVS